MGDYIIRTENLSYFYPDGTKALNGVTLGIKRGKITAVLGGNGAGKTTFFLNLNGIIKPSAGKIFYNEKEIVHTKKNLNELRRLVGLVFQNPDSQLFSANVYQDVSFGPINMGLPAEEVRQKVEECLKKTGVWELRDKPTHSLSFGQKKRVAIAGVLAMEPEVVVLDEPTAGLDPKGVGEVMNLVLELQELHGISVIIATHDIDIVPLYCDYVYVLDQGEVILDGTPDDVFSQAEVLRKVHLRLPRIAHLMEILSKRDGFGCQEAVTTISEARKVIKSWLESQYTVD